MPKSIRPWVTAGIAVVGAGVIVVAPLELAPQTDVQIANAAVELSSTPSPFDYYPGVFEHSLQNAGDLLRDYLAAPLPIVRAIAGSQADAFSGIVDAAKGSDPAAVVRAILKALTQPLVNMVKVIGSGQPCDLAASLIVRLALPIVSGVFAAGAAVGDVVKAVLDLNVIGALSAVTNIPARIVDGLLNGRVNGSTEDYFGLLVPVLEAPVADELTGPIAFLIDSLQGIGETVSPRPPSAASGSAGHIPDLAAPLVTLSVVPLPEKPPVSPAPDSRDAPSATSEAAPQPTEPEGATPSDAGGSLPDVGAEDADDTGEAGEGPAASPQESAPHERQSPDAADDSTHDGGNEASGDTGSASDEG